MVMMALVAAAMCVVPMKVGAQDADSAKIYTLNGCMKYAVENSPTVKKQKYLNDNYRANRDEALASMFPSLSGSSSATTSYGRNVDPETNTYTTTATFGNSYSLYSEMLVFHGFSAINSYRSSRVGVLMGKSDLDQAKDQTALDVMQAFFDFVFYADAVEIARKQCEASRETYVRDSTEETLGMKDTSDVLQVEAQVRSDEYTLVKQENARDLAMATLKQKMNYPSDKDLQIDTNVTFSDMTAAEYSSGLPSMEEVMGYSLKNNPRIRSAEYGLNKSRLDYAAAKGKLFPSIYVGAGLNSAYYENLGSTVQASSFMEQLKNNEGQYLGVSISIPIFDGLSYKSAARRARNTMKIAEQTDEETKRTVANEIAQNYGQMKGFEKEYAQTLKKVEAAETAYRAEQEKYLQGVSSPIELQTAANLLLQARSENLNARLQYMIKYRLMQYYAGRPLISEQ
jgi:outer membrane protein